MLESSCPWCLPHRYQIIRGPAEAAAALYEMLGDPEEDLIVILLCDAEHRIVFADFERATAMDAPVVLDRCLDFTADGPRSLLALAIMGPSVDRCPAPHEVSSLAQLRQQCDGGNVDLLDVLMLSRHGWHSIGELTRLGAATGHSAVEPDAEEPDGGDNRWGDNRWSDDR
jgi:hypothetical protein